MEVVINIDDNLYTRLFDNGIDNYNDALDMAKAIRKGMPLPKGNWINKKCRDGSHLPCCSACGESSGTYYEYNYCPNCGAKMEAEDEQTPG